MKFNQSLLIITIFASFVSNARQLKVMAWVEHSVPSAHVLDLEALSAGPGAPLHNSVVKVVTSVLAGDRQRFYNVLVDTGSGILWLGGEKAYRPGPSTMSLNTTFGVGYGVGSVSGNAFRDEVTIGEASAKGQIIGVAKSTMGFALVKPIDGILGLGPFGSNLGDVFGQFANTSTPTFVETLLANGYIDHAIFGIFITPLGVNGVPEGKGELTFGGTDMSRIKGDVVWVAQNLPVNFHWEFNMTAFSFGNVRLSEPASARTDTGVLAIGIPFDSLFDIRDTYNATITFNGALGAVLSFPSNVTSELPNLSFTLVAGTVFLIPPSRYLVPQNLYASLNLTQTSGLAYSWISSAGPQAYILGQKWLENVYSSYDMENHRGLFWVK